MNITDNLIRIKEGKENIIKSLKNKGVEISDNTLINEIPTIIDNAEIGGGGGDTPSQPEIPELVQKYEGASVFRINVPEDNYEFAINLCNNASTATYDVDWGDGSLEYGKTTDEQHHTYTKKGTYDVNIYNISKDITIIGGTTNNGVQAKYINNVFNNTNDDKYIPFLGIETQNEYICTDILFGDKINSIGSNAFYNYKSLKSVTISENLTSIGSSAFIGSGLKYLNFNAINCNSFSNNSYFGTNLVFVKIGNKVQKIPSYFLTNNNLLTSVNIPNSITSIGSNAFKGCSSLTSITIPDSVKSIGNTVFRDCTSLQNIVIPEGVTSIGTQYAYTFSGCSSLTSITIPDSVTELGFYIFDSCTHLKNVILPKSIKQIPQNAFSKCSSLTSINIPEGVTSIGGYAFDGCSSLTSITIPEGVTSIGSNAFKGCSSLTSVTIPNSVTSIGNNAFDGCSSLTSITIPEGVTSIGSNAFDGCSSLTSITIPEGVTSIGSNAFNACLSLYDINLGNVKTISNSSFYNVYLYTKLIIPSSVTSIGNQSFYSITSNLYLNTLICEPLTAPTIQNSFGANYVSTKRYMYVHKNADIETYTTGNWKTNMLDKGWELRYIEDYEKEPTILKIKTINNFFNDLSNIEQANLINYELVNNEYIYHFDDKISLLHQYFFEKNTLESIEIPSTVTTIAQSAFYKCSSLTSVTIPNSVTSIGNNAFDGCSKLTSVTIPNSVTSINTNVFQNCSSLTSITIPDSVTSIATYAFNNNTSLRSITCESLTAPTIQSNTFSSIGTNVPSGTPKVLRIPQGSSGYEETTSEWYKQLISKGYKVEYIVPNTLNYTSYSGDIVTPYAKSFEGKNEIVSNVYENGKGTITFKEGLSEIYDSMYNKDVVGALTTIEIPNGVTKIGDYSFRSQNLTTLNVPNTVTYIGDSAFNGCTKLSEITLGSGVETIGQWAFSGCTKVSTITSMAMVAPTLNQSFLNVGGDVSGDKILRVPQGAEGYDTWLSQLNGFTVEYI